MQGDCGKTIENQFQKLHGSNGRHIKVCKKENNLKNRMEGFFNPLARISK